MLLFWAQLDTAHQDLVQHPLLNDAMFQADEILYSTILSQMCDNLLQPSTLTGLHGDTASIDLAQLARIGEELENWALTALHPFPNDFADCRVELASRTGHLMRRLVGVAQLVGDFIIIPALHI